MQPAPSLSPAVLPEAALQAKSNSCKFAGTGAKAFIARLSVAAAYEPLKQLPPITGLADQPLLPIAEAVKTLPVTQARSYAFVADTSLEWVTAMHGLTRDEMTAVYMYTMQWVGDQGDSLHVALSKALCSESRDTLKPFLPYLKLLLTGLMKLPPHRRSSLWCGLKGDLTSRYVKGAEVVWWRLTSCVTDMSVLLNPMLVGEEGERTLFCVHSGSGVNIAKLSQYPSEAEIVLPPATCFQVTNTFELKRGLHVIELTEVFCPALSDLARPHNQPLTQPLQDAPKTPRSPRSPKSTAKSTAKSPRAAQSSPSISKSPVKPVPQSQSTVSSPPPSASPSANTTSSPQRPQKQQKEHRTEAKEHRTEAKEHRTEAKERKEEKRPPSAHPPPLPTLPPPPLAVRRSPTRPPAPPSVPPRPASASLRPPPIPPRPASTPLTGSSSSAAQGSRSRPSPSPSPSPSSASSPPRSRSRSPGRPSPPPRPQSARTPSSHPSSSSSPHAPPAPPAPVVRLYDLYSPPRQPTPLPPMEAQAETLASPKSRIIGSPHTTNQQSPNHHSANERKTQPSPSRRSPSRRGRSPNHMQDTPQPAPSPSRQRPANESKAPLFSPSRQRSPNHNQTQSSSPNHQGSANHQSPNHQSANQRAASPSSSPSPASRRASKERVFGSLSVKQLQQMAALGSPEAMFFLGVRLAEEGGPEEQKEAADWLRKAANQGHADAKDHLATLYMAGVGVAQDLSEAYRLYVEGAEAGHTPSMLGAARLLEQADEIPEAVVWLRKAIDLRDPAAMYRLGVFYEQGLVTGHPDVQSALELWTKAVELGHPMAAWNLGKIIKDTDGEAQAYVRLFRLSAERGNMFGCYELGDCYLKGSGVDQDYAQAFYWFNKSAEQGFALAQVLTALCYQQGWGVDQSDEHAVFWYKKAADQGRASACFCLANYYLSGKGGLQKNAELAAKYCKMAAKQDDVNALFLLGTLYERGTGVEQSDAYALQWFKEAAARGHTDAMSSVATYYFFGKGGLEKDVTQTFQWFLKASEAGCANAQYALALMYNAGKGVEQNAEKANYWLKKAAEQGHAYAVETVKNGFEKNKEKEDGCAVM